MFQKCNLIDQPILPKRTHERQAAQQRLATQKSCNSSPNPKSKTTSSPILLFFCHFTVGSASGVSHVCFSGLCCCVFGGILCVCHVSQAYTVCVSCASQAYIVRVYFVFLRPIQLSLIPRPILKNQRILDFRMGLGTRLIATA